MRDGQGIIGRKSLPGSEVLAEQAMRQEASRLVTDYESHEFLVPTPLASPTSIKDVVDHATSCSCARASGPFGVITRAQRVLVRNVADTSLDAPLRVRLNRADNDLVTLDPREYQDWGFVEATDVFVENDSGQAIPVRISLA